MTWRDHPAGTGMRVLVATKPVDFRKRMDGLAAFVKEHLRPSNSGIVYVFRAKRSDRIKLLMWDGRRGTWIGIEASG